MVTERRPHWDDDLTDAVFRALSHTYRAQGWAGGIAIDLDESVYPLIAAVEDWQAEKRRGEAAFSWLMARDARQEAAIQRVRDVTVPVPGDVYDLDSYTRGAADALALTNKALDGGSSTVLPPLPSTPLDQNPVCPACGGTLALERNRVVCLSDEVNHYWYWDGSDD
jgi:hypothetical protein